MKKLVILSGAGLSAPSGLGTFRDEGGLWDRYNIDDVCNIATWRRNYALVHEFYDKRRAELATVAPNAMHFALAELSQKVAAAGCEVVNFTQNVDDLLERAGCEEVLHLHGNLWQLHCADCGDEFELRSAFGGGRCQRCGGQIKPSVVFFGEQAPGYERLWVEFGGLAPSDLVVIIGTSGGVINVNSLLRFFEGTSVLINLERSRWIDESRFSRVLHKSCDECVGELEQIVRNWLTKA